MKRFYCTVCKRIKRVRKYPHDIVTPGNENPSNRLGTCNYHTKTIKGQWKAANMVQESGRIMLRKDVR